MKSSRVGRDLSPSTSRSRTVDASAKSSSANVSSVMVSVVSLSSETGSNSRPAGPRMAPASTNTIGAVIRQ